MGFKTQLDGILEYLPVSRQTMLFSATQTKSVKDLARLSLKKPEYVAVHAQDQEVTPKQLVQNYIVVCARFTAISAFRYVTCISLIL
jgi:ATP-dependent RNA helicase DDX10/DBP4